MWTKEFLSTEQLTFYKNHPWYYKEFEIFSERTKEMISLYKDKDLSYKDKLPPYIGISLTYKCNLSCKMCFQDDRSKYDYEMSSERIIDISNEIKEWGSLPWVTLWGGEPLINKDFQNIYTSFQESAGIVTILTNGLLINRHLDLIMNPDYKTVWVFSMDGTEEIHDNIRGKIGSFKKTMENLKLAVKLRDQYETKNVFGVQITITKQNLDTIPELCDQLIEIGVDWVVLNNLWFLNKQESFEYSNQLLDYNYLEIASDLSSNGFILDDSLIPESNKVFDLIKLCKEKSKDKTLIWAMPDYSRNEISEHYSDKSSHNDLSCYKNLVKLDIDVDGKVVACKQFPDIIYGDVQNYQIKDIWRSKLKFMMQDQIVNTNGFSICNMCPDKALSIKYQ